MHTYTHVVMNMNILKVWYPLALPSASEVTAIWYYRNLIINIIITPCAEADK